MTLLLTIFMIGLHFLLPMYFAYLMLKEKPKDKEGTVIAAVDRFRAQDPPQSDPEHAAGNHVMIACDNTSQPVSVLLAHLQPDSVAVQEGQTISSGQRVGRVGNTGNTTEPHLHVHAVEGRPEGPLQGEGVPILFDGEFPVRNTVFQRDSDQL